MVHFCVHFEFDGSHLEIDSVYEHVIAKLVLNTFLVNRPLEHLASSKY